MLYICIIEAIKHINKKSKMENKFFVYEGQVLRAAQSKFSTAMKYFKKGRTILKGTPDYHKTDLTKIANKLIFSECR